MRNGHGTKYELVLRQRDGNFYILIEWHSGDRDLLWECKKETDALMVFQQLQEKLPLQYYSHREVQRIMQRMPKYSVQQALDRFRHD